LRLDSNGETLFSVYEYILELHVGLILERAHAAGIENVARGNSGQLYIMRVTAVNELVPHFSTTAGSACANLNCCAGSRYLKLSDWTASAVANASRSAG